MERASCSRAPCAEGRTAEATIFDDGGNIVAQRTVTERNAKTCGSLARAAGAWASLVLDAEAQRPTPARLAHDDGTGTSSIANDRGAAALPYDPVAPWPADAARTEAPRWRRAIEIGGMAFLRDGAASTGGLGGLSPFVAFEIVRSVLLRPSFAFASSTVAASTGDGHQMSLTYYGGRLDLCRRIPGNYMERRGIELDICGGGEMGSVMGSSYGSAGPSSDALRAHVGPSAALRGEIGAGIALELRGMTGVNLARAPLRLEGEAPPLLASAEVGASVRLP